jgi:integrase/recombinase XerD
MPTHHPDNERIKRQSEDSVDAVANALARFEADTHYRDFRAFHYELAVAFKRRLADRDSQVSGEKLSKATLNSTLSYLKRFFQWLAQQPGYKSRLNYSDAECFNLSEKDTRVATTRRDRPAPTLEQVKHVIAHMPAATEIERRNRALVAFALLTGARDGALATLRLKHLDLNAGSVYQDARDVDTKFSKSFTTYFFPVGAEVQQVVEEWVAYLRQQKLWGNDDPLFPASRVELGVTRHFELAGIDRKPWSTASPIRGIFKQAFEAAGLPYFNPHSFRRTLVQLGETVCQTPEQFKAWSQNLGHEGVLTTFYSYGSVAERRQGEIIKGLAKPQEAPGGQADAVAQALLRAMREDGLVISQR